jgi:hypothetical protein
MTNQKKLAALLSFAVLVLPIMARGASLLPNCGITDASGKFIDCTFNDVIILVNNVIHFLVFTVSVPLAALGFMWAGANLVLSQNKQSAWSEAKGRLETIGVGFGIMLGTYVLLKVVIYYFLNTEKGFFTFLVN